MVEIEIKTAHFGSVSMVLSDEQWRDLLAQLIGIKAQDDA